MLTLSACTPAQGSLWGVALTPTPGPLNPPESFVDPFFIQDVPIVFPTSTVSPQLETVDGAKPGLLINTITNELFKEIMVVPCAYQRRFIRWAPRSTGGGYKGELNPVDVETGNVPGLSQHQGMYLMDVPEGSSPFDPKGVPLYDHLSDTRNHFVLAKNAAGAWQPALVSLASTQIKKSKRWMSRIQGVQVQDGQGRAITPPSFSHIYVLKAVKEGNSKGEWWGMEIDLVEAVKDAQLYQEAKKFNQSVNSGAVEVAPPPASGADSGADNSEKF
jgi:hypothetical protein